MNRPSNLAYTFGVLLGFTFIFYILRGLGYLSFMPGGILLSLIAASIVTGIIYGIQKTRRL
ncbi:MAG: hypothetical protein N5P05_002058 [Chroococcopsis gigantea SAG 12.99]|jgi:hypothetical protein|nr:hypothetical protein [Chlorogloea purpurea SAG 13.99]MDV3000452.1 hypothetical protein [Chroococcopsis gigantea SAG 12.99]